MNEQWRPYGASDDDPDELVTRDTARQIVGQEAARIMSAQQQAQAVASEFFGRHPDLREADPQWLIAVGHDIGRSRPDLNAKVQTPEGRAEFYDVVAEEAKRRAQRLAGGPGGRSMTAEEMDRQEALREYDEQYRRAKLPPSCTR
jgi:hypothetical protein